MKLEKFTAEIGKAVTFGGFEMIKNHWPENCNEVSLQVSPGTYCYIEHNKYQRVKLGAGSRLILISYHSHQEFIGIRLEVSDRQDYISFNTTDGIKSIWFTTSWE